MTSDTAPCISKTFTSTSLATRDEARVEAGDDEDLLPTYGRRSSSLLQNSISCLSSLQSPTFSAASATALTALVAVVVAAVAVALALLLATDVFLVAALRAGAF